MQKRGKACRLALLLLFCLPLTALADAGTPLMWAGLAHMVIGNGLIGIGEGILLAFLFRLSKRKCVEVMIAANYFSAWFGDLFVLRYALKRPDLDLYNAWHWVWAMVAVTFVLTCLLEWPFVFFCLQKSEHRVKKSIWGNLLIQSISYLLIFGWYWGASARSLYTQMHIVQPTNFPVPTNAVVYFISTNGNVCSMKFASGGTVEKVASLNSTNEDDRLFLRQSEPGKFSIYARLETPPNTNSIQCVISNVETLATVPQYDQKENPNEIYGTWAPQWDVARIGSALNSPWKFITGFSAAEGLLGENQKTGKRLHLAFETPFAQWMVRNGYHLPGDCVVFQLGNNQICILDPNTKRVALLAKGHGPVVMLE